MAEISHVNYNGDSKVIIRLCEAVNALIDRGGGKVSLLISKTVTENGIYSAEDENALGYSTVTVNVPTAIPGLLTPSVFDLDTGYVSGGNWTLGGDTVNYSDVYAVEADKLYFIALGANVGTRFRAMFSETDIATASANVKGSQIVNISNPAAYAYTVYTPSASGYITITKDNAGTANIKTYVFNIHALIDGISQTNGGGQSGGE